LLLNVLLVAVGGACGSVLRYLVALAGTRWLGPDWPSGTVFVNVSGSLLMGVAVEMITRRFGGSGELRLLLTTGFLGGYTTFSSFSLDAAVLWERGDTLASLVYVLGSVGLGLVALFAGLALARHML
jgi:fluoride exporter